MKSIGRNKKALKIAVVLAAFLLTATILAAVTTSQTQNQNQNAYPLINAYLQSVSPSPNNIILPKYDIDHSITLNGSTYYETINVLASDIVIDGNGSTVQGTGSGYGFNLTGVSNVTIYNVTVTGWGNGFYLNDSANNNLTGNTVNNNGWGFYLENSANNKLSGNVIYGSGFWLVSSSSNTLSGNTVTNGYIGIGLDSGSNCNNLSNNVVNNPSDWAYYGIGMTQNSNYTTLLNNIVNPGGAYGLFMDNSSHNILLNNTAINNFLIGIQLENVCNNNTISGNIANDNPGNTTSSWKVGFGINIAYGLNNTVSGNTANNNAIYGFQLESSSYNNLTGNTSNNNTIGFLITPSPYFPGDSNNNNLTGNTANNNTQIGFWINASSYNNLTGNTAANNGYGFRLNESSTYNNLLGNVAINSTTGGYNWTIDCIDNDFMGSVEANYLRVYVNVSSGLPLRGVQVQVVSNGTVWYATPGFGGAGSPTGKDGYTPWFAVPYRTFTGNDTMNENNNTVTVKYSTLWKIAKFSNNPLTEVNMSTQHTEYFTVTSWQPTLLQTMLPLMLFSLIPRGIPTIYATVGIAAIAIVAAAALTYHYRRKIFK